MKTILILEDEPIIAIELETAFTDRAVAVAGPFESVKDAGDWLETEPPAFAILDIRLDDGHSVSIARELEKRGVPYAVYSGYPRDHAYGAVHWFPKPTAADEIANVAARYLI